MNQFIILILLSIYSFSISVQFYKISKNTWEKEYENGDWKYLDKETFERSRTAVVSVFASLIQRDGYILDVGCGEGVLSDFLPYELRKNYTGIDISKKAVELARLKRNLNVFSVTAEDFDLSFLVQQGIDVGPKGLEVIVFNEVLYYVDHVKIMKKFAQYLSPTGIVVISSWFSPTEWRKSNDILKIIFRDAEKIFTLKDDITITGVTGDRALGARIGLFTVKKE